MGMARPHTPLVALIGIILFGAGPHGAAAGQAGSSYRNEPIKRFATIPIESVEWCDATAKEFQRRVGDAKVGKAFVYYPKSETLKGYWIDTADGGSIGLVCFDKTAIVVGQKNASHLKEGRFMGTITSYGPQCRLFEDPEVFYQNQNVSVYWTNRAGNDDVTICMSGIGSISLSRVRA